MPTTEHTLKQFDTELEAVRARVLQMGGLVEEQIVRALDALSNGNLPLAERVVEDDHRWRVFGNLDESLAAALDANQLVL